MKMPLTLLSRSTALPRSKFNLALLFVNLIMISRVFISVAPPVEFEAAADAPTRCALSILIQF